MAYKMTKYLLAASGINGLNQAICDSLDDAHAWMKREFSAAMTNVYMDRKYGGELNPRFAVIKSDNETVAEWSIIDVDMELPKNISAMATISTAHIDKDTSELFKDRGSRADAAPPVYAKGEYGWLVYVPEDEKDDSEIKCLRDIAAWARRNGISVVCLDCDAEPVPELKTYDW